MLLKRGLQIKYLTIYHRNTIKLRDNLGSIKMTIGSTGNVVVYDDYYPFGMTMSGRSSTGSADNRYKFTGKERDFGETGWDYFGERYSDSRIGRWLQVDPLANKYPGLSPYNYVRNNPLSRIDLDGRTDWLAVIKSSLRITAGVLAHVGGTATIIESVAASEATWGTSLLGITAGIGLQSLGASEVAFGIGDFKTALATPNGMKAETYKTLSEMIGKSVGLGEQGQKILKLAQAIATGGKDIPKYLLNDKIVQAYIASSEVSESLVELLNSYVKNGQQKNNKQKENEKKTKKTTGEKQLEQVQ
jgi:RHS repeat-associated protein